MKTLAITNSIKNIKTFTAEWVSTGKKQVSAELLDDYCQQIEIAATADSIINYYLNNQQELTTTYYEIYSDKVSLSSFVIFIVNEFASTFPFNDGGNITYSLTPRF
jgi:hypothetical protein